MKKLKKELDRVDGHKEDVDIDIFLKWKMRTGTPRPDLHNPAAIRNKGYILVRVYVRDYAYTIQ